MSENNKYILEVNELSKSFPKSDFCLDKVSFVLPYGEIMGFVGENGAGKTTTIRCILNSLTTTSGNIRLFGEELTNETIEIKEKIGVVYDASNFSCRLTPENISKVMEGIYHQWDNNKFNEYLNIFNLPLKQKISTFSKGMTMKLALSVALSHNPELLILDEVTSGLDPVARDEILDVFLDFVQEESHSLFLSSHITSDLEKIADYITFIHKGHILLTASKDDLLYKYGVIRCKSNEFEEIDKSDIISYYKKDYSIDILVDDVHTMKLKYPNMVIDTVSIDDILLMLVKGARV